MPYAPRDQESSTYFHVFSRGADRQDIYSIDGDHRLFEELLALTTERFDIEAHAYALMSNHFHLIVRVPTGDLSNAMRFLLGQYARAYNQRTSRSGPVFDSRFGSVAIAGDRHRSAEQHLYIAARYVHRNPLAFVPNAALGAYTFSSLGVYLDRRPAPRWLSTGVIGPMIDPAGHLDELLSVEMDDVLPFGELEPSVRSTLPMLETAVAAVLADPRQGRASRLVAMTLAVELRLGGVPEIAGHFGVGAAAIRKAARLGRVRLVEDDTFAAVRERVLDELHSAARNRGPVRLDPLSIIDRPLSA